MQALCAELQAYEPVPESLHEQGRRDLGLWIDDGVDGDDRLTRTSANVR